MDNFKVIYQILKYLEAAMDAPMYDGEAISPGRLRVSRERWEQILYMMQEAGYINGLVFTQGMGDDRPRIVEPARPRVTLNGLEYLSENTMMKKAENLLKGIKESVPGL